MTHPKVLIASPIRQRDDLPEVHREAIKSWLSQDWPANRLEMFWLLNGSADWEVGELLRELAIEFAQDREHPGIRMRGVVDYWAQRDSRLIGGPRSTGHTTERLAHYRNLILERFQESECDLLLMVDSDVILAPGALRRMVETLRERVAEFGCRANRHEKRERLTFYATLRATCTLQIDNRLAEDHAPASNGQAPTAAGMMPAPYATDGSVIEVARAGACTLYPRSVLARRFRWDPRYNEEHQAFFDDLRELGFRHYLIRDPALAEHRMTRDRPL